MDFWESGNVSFGGVYGPAGGPSTSEQASTSGPMDRTIFGLEIPALLVLGFATWWVIKKLD